MPTVSRYGVPQVAPQAAPNVRVNPNVPSGAFQPPEPVDLSGVTHVAAQIAQDERQKANEVATLDADNQLSDARNQLLYDPNNGILSAKGKNALDAAQGWQDRWTQTTGQIRQGLANDDQRLTFDRLAQGQYARANEEVESHVAAQRQVYEQGVVSSSLDLIHNDIVRNAGNPDVVAANIAKGQAIALDWSRRNGMSPEQTQDTVAKLTSTAHASVIEALVNSDAVGSDQQAAQYFAAHHTELVASDLAPTERIVEQATLRSASQQQSDAIMAKATSFGQALELSKAITDPKLRDEVAERLRRGYEDKAASDRESRQQAFDQAARTVQTTGDFDKVPKSLLLQLSPTEVGQLRGLEDDLRHPKTPTDEAYFAHLMNMSALNDATRGEFSRLDLTSQSVRAKLSDSDYKYILELQRSTRLGLGRTSTASARVRQREEQKVLGDLRGAAATAAGNAAALKAAPSSAKFLPPVPRVNIPQWMLDSAKVDPDYADYLRMFGADVGGSDSASAPTVTAPQTPAPPRTPGGPINRPPDLSTTGLPLTPKP